MEPKILRQAIAFAPDKIEEFILDLYNEADRFCKAEIEAKFERYFTQGGSLLPDDTKPENGAKNK